MPFVHAPTLNTAELEVKDVALIKVLPPSLLNSAFDMFDTSVVKFTVMVLVVVLGLPDIVKLAF